MDGAAQTLVSNVGQLVGEEFRHLRGVGGEVARLRNKLATINALLRMQSEVDEGSVDHFVREWMKQLREVAYDAEDCVHLYLFRVRWRLGDHFFINCKRLLTTLMARHRLAGDIRDLRSLASSINEQHARYGFSLEALRRMAASGPVQQALAQSVRPLRSTDNIDDDHSHHHQFVGNKAQAIFLASKVKALNGESDKQLKVLSIVGFGGLGKTTLAVEVCRQLETDFPHQAKVSVSQTFCSKDLQALLKRLLQQIAQPSNEQADSLAGNIDTMPVDDLELELQKRVENKSYE